MLRIRLLLLQLAFVSTGYCQQLYVENYTPANGLLDNRITRIFQDQRGLLYFLTWEGISVFDGQQFENITEYNGESLGLVNDIIQWKNDTCYVFTFLKGAYKLINNRLIRDSSLNHITEPTRLVSAGLEEWIIVTNAGLFRWNGKHTTPLHAGPGKQPETGVENAVVANGQLIYFKQDEKMLRVLDIHTGQTRATLPGKRTTAIVQKSPGEIFILSDGEWMQLHLPALERGVIELDVFTYALLRPDGFRIQQIYANGDHLWFQDLQKGFLLLHTLSGKIQSFPSNLPIDGNANIISIDRENNFWISSFNKKLQKAFYTKLQQLELSGVTSLQNNEAGKSLALTGHQAWWIEKGKAVPASAPGKDPISLYWQNKTWYFNRSTELRSPAGEKIELHLPGTSSSSFFFSNRFQTDPAGRLIISGNSLFITEKNLQVKHRPLSHFTDNMVSTDDRTLIAFNRGGLVRTYRLQGDSIVEDPVVYRLKNLDPRCAIQWNKDTFCVGTRFQGIVWLKLEKEKIREISRISTSRGLSNNFVIALARRNNELYAGTGTGFDLVTWSGTDTTIQNLAAANNLFASFNWITVDRSGWVTTLSADGQLWQVTDNPSPRMSSPPAAWFQRIEMNGKEWNLTAKRFEYNQNNFRFVVTAPCYSNASQLRFRFRLKGGRKEWEQQSSNNYFNISNLSPADYELQVTVMYPGKMYPDRIISWTFTIESPFWKKGWFILLMISLAVSIIWAVARTYYRKKLAIQQAEAEKQQAIEKERNRISRDMHDDLGSGLTKIAILSEVAKKQIAEPEKAGVQLEKISASSRELVDNLQDIIWVLNPSNDRMESLAAYIREYSLKFFEPLELDIRFNYPESFQDRHLSEEKRRNLFLTIKESLHNIAKYAACRQVVISIEEEPGYYLISIKDDGKGFDAGRIRPFANGLQNMENRISQSGGTYEISSAPGQGTCTRIRMPV